GRFFEKVLLPVSQASYGMFLCHMFLLAAVSAWLRTTALTTPLQVLCTAALSFTGVALFCVLVRRIPKIGKLIIG
ncbi:MAG: hypothetical protein J5745_01520, partial [Bacteroidales bacterium]|nr:hypothetical protein [Bacteroidales bacterium]